MTSAATDVYADTIDLEEAERFANEPVVPEIVEDWIGRAHRDLEIEVAARTPRVEPSALDEMTDWLRHLVGRLTNLVVLQRFSSYRLVTDPFWRPRAICPGDAPPGATRTRLDAYITWERSQGLLTDKGPYPELTRLLQLVRSNWLGAVVELVERLELHRGEVATVAGTTSGSPGRLTGARFGISDTHMGGRTAAILVIDDRRLVYKPRALDAEIAWSRIAALVTSEALGLDLMQPHIAGFDGYGFMSYVDHARACTTIEEVRRCYARFGALLATAHALGTADLHHENVIVSGEHPVVVDAEPLFRARLALSESGASRLGFERSLSLDGLDVRESVFDLGLLPFSMRSPMKDDDDVVDDEYEIGGLCPYASTPIRQLVPSGRGSDDLQMRPVAVTASQFPNLPALDGETRIPRDFVTDLIGGFESAHEYLRAVRSTLLDETGPIAALAPTRVRLLARPTMDYVAVLARSFSPEALASPERRRQLISGDLSHLGAGRFDTIGELASSEIRSLFAGDIPRFEVRANALDCEGATLLEAPVAGARARLYALDEVDRHLQIVSVEERLTESKQRRTPELDRLEAGALEVVAALVGAHRSPGADPFWVYVNLAPGLAATMVHADRESLYEGAAGTAVVVAEAGRLAGETRWGDLAASVFGPIVRGETPASARRGGGLARGLGGVVYALTRVGDATGDAALLSTAERIALRYGPDVASEPLDELLYGRAGFLLSLLALERRKPSEALAALADATARGIARRAERAGSAARWSPPGVGPMPNVAHGTAGIAMALGRWAGRRDDGPAAELTRRALRFDSTTGSGSRRRGAGRTSDGRG